MYINKFKLASENIGPREVLTDCAMVTCFKRLLVPIRKKNRNQVALRKIKKLKWLQKFLANERLELSILAMLARRSNRLRYGD